jgi:hypothetical protein
MVRPGSMIIFHPQDGKQERAFPFRFRVEHAGPPGRCMITMKKIVFPIFGILIVINSGHRYFGIHCDHIEQVFSKFVSKLQDRQSQTSQLTGTIKAKSTHSSCRNANWKNVQRSYTQKMSTRFENKSVDINSAARMAKTGCCHKIIQTTNDLRPIHNCPYILRLRLVNRINHTDIKQQQQQVSDGVLLSPTRTGTVDVPVSRAARRTKNVRVAGADSLRASSAALRQSVPPSTAPISLKGPRCRASGCLKGAYFGVEGGHGRGRGRPEWCSNHRLDGHTNVRDKRCQYPEVV